MKNKQTKYLFYTNTGLSRKQIGLSLEYIEQCIEDNIDFKILTCNNILENCYFNPVHNTVACASCQSRFNHVLKEIGVNKNQLVPLKRFNVVSSFPNFTNLDALLNYEYDEINVGRGVASSVISYYRNYNLSSEKHKNIIELELRKSINVLRNIKEVIQSYQPDKIIIFNGRFAEIHPLIAYCKKFNINFTTLEAGALNNYELFENNLPHSIKNRTEKMIQLWESETDLKKKEDIGHEWFKKKRFGDESFEHSFTKNQNKDSLPANFDTSKINVSLMNSSEDELKAISEWDNPLFNTQNEAINKIVDHYKNNSNVHFYLRVHPNLGLVDNVQIKEIEAMDYPNLTIIGPNEKIDTYALLDACNKNIVFGSTSGIEATYWGNVSILLGKSFYYLLEESCYKPTSYKELYSLIEAENLMPKPQENCLPYGYYFSTYGTKTKYFKFDGLENSSYKGKRIKKWYPESTLYLLKYLLNIKQWFVSYKAVIGKSLKLKDLFRYKI